MTMVHPDPVPARMQAGSLAIAPARSAAWQSSHPGDRFYARFGKRALDLFLVLLTLPISLFLVALLAVLVAAEGGQPFHVQDRIGRGGRRYRLWKLRSMVPDAEARLAACLAADSEACAEWARTQKLKNDPRITRIGALLRSASLDELPQLWNVLRGDMSLVGPRPMLPEQQALYPGRAYYDLRPGITGPWQVSKRNESAFADRAEFDETYAERLSLGTDLRLLLATVRVVLRRTGY
jgi:lipopolysaccharide/colanic/teichoic acid biosynthesis glycosyltransferase